MEKVFEVSSKTGHYRNVYTCTHSYRITHIYTLRTHLYMHLCRYKHIHTITHTHMHAYVCIHTSAYTTKIIKKKNDSDEDHSNLVNDNINNNYRINSLNAIITPMI